MSVSQSAPLRNRTTSAHRLLHRHMETPCRDSRQEHCAGPTAAVWDHSASGGTAIPSDAGPFYLVHHRRPQKVHRRECYQKRSRVKRHSVWGWPGIQAGWNGLGNGMPTWNNSMRSTSRVLLLFLCDVTVLNVAYHNFGGLSIEDKVHCGFSSRGNSRRTLSSCASGTTKPHPEVGPEEMSGIAV
jgi:hypothetical protein